MVNDEAGARNLVLEVQKNGRAASVTVRGELDVSTAPELADRAGRSRREGTMEVVLDLEETSFLDSSGLRALIGARHVFGDAGGNLRLYASERTGHAPARNHRPHRLLRHRGWAVDLSIRACARR